MTDQLDPPGVLDPPVRGRLGSLTPEHRAFLRHLSWSALGGTVGAGLMFVASLLAGRLLGPRAFGTAALGLLVAQIFAVLACGGLDVAASRLLPREPDDSGRTRMLTTLTFLVIPLVVALGALGLLAAPAIANLADSSVRLARFGIGLGVIIAVRVAVDRQVASLRLFRFQSLIKLTEGALVVALVIASSPWLRDGRFGAYLAALAGGGAVVAIATAMRCARYVRGGQFDRARAVALARYGGITLLHAITPAGFVYFDRITVKSGLGDAGLGLYMAYYTASFLIVGQVTAVVTNVLMPYSAERDDQRGVVDVLRRARRLGAVPTFAGMAAIGWLILVLGFGTSYDYDVVAGLLAAAWATFLLFNGLATTIAITYDERSFLITVLFQGVRSLVFVAYGATLLAADAVSIRLVLAGMVGLELLDTLNLEFVIRRYVLGRARSSRAGTDGA